MRDCMRAHHDGLVKYKQEAFRISEAVAEVDMRRVEKALRGSAVLFRKLMNLAPRAREGDFW